jgi:hypothetical protein
MITRMTPLEFASAVRALQQAHEVILIHMGTLHRNPASKNSDAQIAAAVEGHRIALSEIWQPTPKPMSAVSPTRRAKAVTAGSSIGAVIMPFVQT